MKDEIFKNAPDLKRDLTRAAHNGPGRIVDLDIEKYLPLLDDPNLTEDQKWQVIEALGTIVIAFVELGFGTHPAAQACGQVDLQLDLERLTDSNVIEGHAEEMDETPNQNPDT